MLNALRCAAQNGPMLDSRRKVKVGPPKGNVKADSEKVNESMQPDKGNYHKMDCRATAVVLSCRNFTCLPPGAKRGLSE